MKPGVYKITYEATSSIDTRNKSEFEFYWQGELRQDIVNVCTVHLGYRQLDGHSHRYPMFVSRILQVEFLFELWVPPSA